MRYTGCKCHSTSLKRSAFCFPAHLLRPKASSLVATTFFCCSALVVVSFLRSSPVSTVSYNAVANLQTSIENAPDRGAEDLSQRTLGVVSSMLPLGSGSSPILVREHGGLPRFRGLGAIDGGLACPTSVYVVVVSLTADKAESKQQIKYW